MTSKNYISPLCSCIECKNTFSEKAINTHFLAKHTNDYKRNSYKGQQKFQLRCSCTHCKLEISTQNISRHYQNHFKPDTSKPCPKCSIEHSNNGKFCSLKCANSKNFSNFPEESKQKILKNLKERKQKPPFCKISFCKNCNKCFLGQRKSCSDLCKKELIRQGGIKSSANRVRRSRDEIKLFDLCDNYFRKVEHNKNIFNGWDADILIYDYKIAILWNGPWHYRNMGLSNHSLIQVQNRDKIKLKEISKCGWKSLVFEDRYYTPSEAFDYILNTLNA